MKNKKPVGRPTQKIKKVSTSVRVYSDKKKEITEFGGGSFQKGFDRLVGLMDQFGVDLASLMMKGE